MVQSNNCYVDASFDMKSAWTSEPLGPLRKAAELTESARLDLPCMYLKLVQGPMWTHK